MPLRIPTRPATTSAYGATSLEIVANAVIDACGPVITYRAALDFAARHKIKPKYVRCALQLYSEIGILDHPRRELWVPIPRHPDPGADDELRARAAVHATGAWSIPIGVWALSLAGIAVERWPEDALRSCASPRPARLATHREHPDDPDMPAQTRSRHVIEILGEPVGVVCRSQDHPSRCAWLVLGDDAGVHVEQPADALVTMFEHPRLCGGFDVALATLPRVVEVCGLSSVVRAAQRTRRGATKRRLAFAFLRAGARDEFTSDLVDDLEKWWWEDERYDLLLGFGRARHLTPLDPHRCDVEGGARRYGVMDNRGAPLRTRLVTLPREVRGMRSFERWVR